MLEMEINIENTIVQTSGNVGMIIIMISFSVLF